MMDYVTFKELILRHAYMIILTEILIKHDVYFLYCIAIIVRILKSFVLPIIFQISIFLTAFTHLKIFLRLKYKR